MWNSRIKNSEQVVKGQTLDYITDIHGESTIRIPALHDGYIIAVNNFRIVSRGDAIIHIGK